jgi:hypothetical protein
MAEVFDWDRESTLRSASGVSAVDTLPLAIDLHKV